MSLDELLFKKSYAWFSKLRRGKTEVSLQAALLDDHKDRLLAFARVFSGRAIDIAPSADNGTYTQHTLFLPPQFDICASVDENIILYLHRIVVNVGLQNQNVYLAQNASPTIRQKTSIEAAQKLYAQYLIEFPHLQEWKDLVEKLKSSVDEKDRQAKDQLLHKIYGDVGFFEERQDISKNLGEQKTAQKNASIGTEIKAKHQDRISVIKNPKRDDDNPVIHAFEKVQTVESYQGGERQLDGADELAEQADALDEISIGHIIRTTERSESLYKADIRFHASAPDFHASAAESDLSHTYFYDEWNEAKRAFRKDWCRVVEWSHGNPPTNPAAVEAIERMKQSQTKVILKLALSLERLRNRRRYEPRKPDGCDIELDGVIDYFCEQRAQRDVLPNFYLQRVKATREVATLILIDSSLSSDSYVNNRRVLDVVREAVIAMSEVLCNSSDTFAVASFHSHTRHKCQFEIVKSFRDPWDKCEQRMMAVEPEGYTRIGPAIRHATMLLSKQPARSKLLLILSDGKATDYDNYEGQYGLSDIRQALEAARTQGIHAHGLAVTAEAKDYLPLMFGHRQYSILSNTRNLPETLFSIYRKAVG